jgi:hypothetical protein
MSTGSDVKCISCGIWKAPSPFCPQCGAPQNTMVHVPSASDNKQSTSCLCSQCPSFKQCVGGERFDTGNGL